MLDKDIEQEMEAIAKELDVCEKKRLQAVEKDFWQQMVYVVAGGYYVRGCVIIGLEFKVRREV